MEPEWSAGDAKRRQVIFAVPPKCLRAPLPPFTYFQRVSPYQGHVAYVSPAPFLAYFSTWGFPRPLSSGLCGFFPYMWASQVETKHLLPFSSLPPDPTRRISSITACGKGVGGQNVPGDPAG